MTRSKKCDFCGYTYGTHEAGCEGIVYDAAEEDREPDGECFRGDEAAAYLRDQQIEARKIK